MNSGNSLDYIDFFNVNLVTLKTIYIKLYCVINIVWLIMLYIIIIVINVIIMIAFSYICNICE